jgi:tetratricopeptide (TPR) repeat protein
MGVAHPRVAGPKARAAALRAVELDDTSAVAHEALAVIKTWTDWDWAGAEPEWRSALELDPNAANTHAYFAHFLAITGRIDEAIPHSERAIELDPYNALFHALYGVVLLSDRRFDDATAARQAALSIHPNYPFVLNGLRNIYIAKGMRDELLTDQRKRIAHDPELLAVFEQSLAEAGHETAYRRLADLLAARYEESGGIVPQGFRAMGIVRRYLAAGDNDHAIDWLEKAYEEEHSPAIPYLSIQPIYDPLRSDPRFQDLLRRMNLPVQ